MIKVRATTGEEERLRDLTGVSTSVSKIENTRIIFTGIDPVTAVWERTAQKRPFTKQRHDELANIEQK